MTSGSTASTRTIAGETDRPGAVSLPVLGGYALLLVGFVALFYRWFYTQHLHSKNAFEDWGHAYAIPLIAGYLVWLKRDQIVKTPVSTFWPGLIPFLLGIVCYFLFCVPPFGNHMLQGFSIILTLFGVVLTMLGPAMMRHLFLPIAFLALGVTISEMVMLRVTWPLQQIAASGGYIMLDAIGAVFDFDVTKNGNVLTVIGSDGIERPMNVAEACSGMRMVIAFIALAAAVALIGTENWWQRVAILLLAAPVAILMNVVRVAVLGIASLKDTQLASGSAHTLIGTLLLVPALLLFMSAVWALNKIVKEPGAKGNA